MVKKKKTQTSSKLTAETAILVCQCGHTVFDPTKRTRTAVAFECTKCGGKVSVKGNVALPVQSSRSEVAHAIADNVVRPDPGVGGQPKGPTLGDLGYRTLRFKISEDQDKLVQRALETVRVMNCKDEKFRNQQWQGNALEYICADFMGGVDPRALSVVDRMDEVVKEEAAKHLQKTGQTHLTKRKVRTIRSTVRDRVAEELGLIGSDEYVPPDDSAAEGREEFDKSKARQKAEDEADSRMNDDDRLFKAVSNGMQEYLEECTAQLGGEPKMLLSKGDKYQQLFKKWEKGGLFFKIIGDEVTKDAAGNRPVVYLWLEEEHEELSPDLSVAYCDVYDGVLDDIELEVVELLPFNYDEISEDERWDETVLATRREKVQ